MSNCEERFWSKTEWNGECLEWTGYRIKQGYGRFRKGNQMVLAHREAYRLTYPDQWDSDLYVLHSCDNPPCVRPEHLRQGTKSDNMQDSIMRGRWNPNGVRDGKTRGERNGASKLTEGDVRAVRDRVATGEEQRTVAAEYGLSEASVSMIVRGLRWRHVS